MRQIKLVTLLEFGSRVELAIIDMTEAINGGGNDSKKDFGGKKRGTITVDYSPSDLRELRERGLDLSGMLQHYESRIYCLVKYYISGDWEYMDSENKDSVINMLKRHIDN